MNITIRKERKEDYSQVEKITREAFWNLYVPGASEHYLVHTMRDHKDYLPELSFVIEQDNKIVGSIHFTTAWIIEPNGQKIPIVHLGPVAITPALHRKGLGRQLITHAIDTATSKGYRAIVLGGFKYHYEPYGFMPSKKYNITMEDGLYYKGIMLLPLYEHALDKISGTLELSPALYPDTSDFEVYDTDFPATKKEVLPCQEQFTIAAMEQDFDEY